MPNVTLPADFVDELNTTESGLLSSTTGPGVAAYVTADRRQRADVYIGLKLDGVKLYENINNANPNIKFRFALEPTVSCPFDPAHFNLKKGSLIVITVSPAYRCRSLC